ncbi:hypothetical protein QUF72_15470 [Desulfobacterales bacterium HSG2]|nr:hypothetical protein [Desulfobacterales bacterium HSG2]
MDDNTALKKMFRARKKMLMGIGFDESRAVLKAIESIRDATGIDITERPGIELPELEKMAFVRSLS